MVERILYWLQGYLVLKLQSIDISRLLNLCKLNDIQLIDVKQKDSAVLFHLSKKNYEKMLPFIDKCQMNGEIVKQVGLVYFLRKYRKSFVFLICVLSFIAILFSTSKFIWHISIDGESDYTEEEIVTYIEKNLVPMGTRISSIQISNLERNLREHFDRVAWISCEIKGTNLKVHMVETVCPDMIFSKKEPCNIVAIKDGLVTDITATCGKKVVDAGTEVKKGDILITGVVNVQNEYEEIVETTYVAASGMVYAKTKYTYSREIPLTSTKKYYTGKWKSGYILDFWGNSLYIKKPRNVKDYDIVSESSKLKLLNSYYLPVTFTKNKYHQFEYKQVTLTPEQANKKQQEILGIYMDGLQKKGVEILQNNVTIECVNGVSLASGTIVVKELIGVPETFTEFN